MGPRLVEIVTTVSTEEGAAALVRRLVEEGVVACASFFPVRSVYRWEGRVCDEPEYQITMKTVADKAEQVERWLAENHPYDVPAILCLPVARVNASYGDWVAANVGDDSS